MKNKIKTILKNGVSGIIAVLLISLVIPGAVFAGQRDVSKKQVRVIIENNTYLKDDGAPWDGVLLDEWVDIDDSSTMMSCIVTALDEKKYAQEGADQGYITSINNLAANDGGVMAGWMGTLNDWFTAEGFSAYTVAAGTLSANDEIKIVYSCDMGEDCGGSWNNNNKTLSEVSFSAGALDKTFSPSEHEYTLIVPIGTNSINVTPTASNKNFLVKIYKGTQEEGTEYKRTQTIPVQVGDVITIVDGDPAWPSMNNSPYGTGDTVAKETYTFTIAEQGGYLSEIAFGSGNKAEFKGEYRLSPAFQPKVFEYTLSVPDSVVNVYAWATLSEAGTGKTIKANYTKTTSASGSATIKTANATGVSLASLVAKGKNGNDSLTIDVGDQSYAVKVVRLATLSNLTFNNGEAIETTNEAFAATTNNYTMMLPTKVTKLAANVTKTTADAVVTVNGKSPESFDLTWDGNQATITVEVSYGTEASKNVYTIVASVPSFKGSGTEEDPFLIENINDLVALRDYVNSGVPFSGKYFKLTSDVTLPSKWAPIGDLKESAKSSYFDYSNTIKVKDSTPFSGIFDGDGHTITVPEGEFTAFGSVYHATLKNFKIYGTKIPGYGVVQYWLQRTDASHDNEVIIENVTLKSGTRTMMSGFIGGYESGMDRIIMRNCEVESGVVIGNDGKGFWKDYETTEALPKTAYAYGPTAPIYQNDFVGSFVGAGSGEIVNCHSSATVYGNNYVGGIWGMKGQSMGDCLVRECSFDGKVIANGQYAGGIMGAGYTSSSAPNTPCVTIQNCVCYGEVTAADYVGGIFGGEIFLKQNWNNGVGYIQNNFFGGKITSDGTNKGAIIGYFGVLDNCNIISNNFYIGGCGAEKGMILNAVETENAQYIPAYEIKAGDDPESFCKKVKNASEAIEALNSGANTSTTWKIQDGKAVVGNEKHLISIYSSKLNANPPKTLTEFNELDDEELIATYNDGTVETIKVSDCEKVDWNFLSVGYRAVQLIYKNTQCVFLLKNTEVIEDPAVAAVDKAIEDLGEITLDKEKDVDAIIEAYGKLSASQKAQVKNGKTLLEAKEKIEALKLDKAEAQKVDKKIEEIGEVTLDSKDKIESAEKAYKALTDSQKSFITKKDTLEKARETYDKLVKEQTKEYKMIEGANQTVYTGKDAVFRSEADFSKFKRVLVDKEVISSDNYTVKEGSTIVTLKASYTNTLANGKHSITIESVDGRAFADFIVASNQPGTGDSSNMMLFVILAIVALMAGTSAVIAVKRIRR